MIEQFVDVGRILRHGVLKAVVGIRVVAKQFGDLVAHFGDAAQDFCVVKFSADALRVVCLVQLLAQVAA